MLSVTAAGEDYDPQHSKRIAKNEQVLCFVLGLAMYYVPLYLATCYVVPYLATCYVVHYLG